MRMWMLPTAGMCRKHLLGEHVELHMLLGSLRRGKNIDGFLSGGLVDPQGIFARHEELVAEMTRRGFKHNSPLDEHECAALAAGFADRAIIDIAANARDCTSAAQTAQAAWQQNNCLPRQIPHPQ